MQETEIDKELRSLVVRIVEGDRDPTKTELATIEAYTDGRKLAAVEWAVEEAFTTARTGGRDGLATASKRMSELAALQACGALLQMVRQRKAWSDEFEKTPFFNREAKARAASKAAGEALAAAKLDENATPIKLSRLQDESNTLNKVANEIVNSRDPELLEFRDRMKPTTRPGGQERRWEDFVL